MLSVTFLRQALPYAGVSLSTVLEIIGVVLIAMLLPGKVEYWTPFIALLGLLTFFSFKWKATTVLTGS